MPNERPRMMKGPKCGVSHAENYRCAKAGCVPIEPAVPAPSPVCAECGEVFNVAQAKLKIKGNLYHQACLVPAPSMSTTGDYVEMRCPECGFHYPNNVDDGSHRHGAVPAPSMSTTPKCNYVPSDDEVRWKCPLCQKSMAEHTATPGAPGMLHCPTGVEPAAAPEATRERKPRLYKDYRREQLLASPMECAHYLMAAAEDSREAFVGALENILDAWRASLSGSVSILESHLIGLSFILTGNDYAWRELKPQEMLVIYERNKDLSGSARPHYYRCNLCGWILTKSSEDSTTTRFEPCKHPGLAEGDAGTQPSIKVLASALKKVLPPELLQQVIDHCDPLAAFLRDGFGVSGDKETQ